MKLLCVWMVLLLPLKSLAAFDIKPGLWQTKMQITMDGKTVDPQAEINKAYANIPPEQKKQIAALMAKAGQSQALFGDEAMKLCWTTEMLAKPEKVTQTKDCQTTITSQTPKKITGTFNCRQDKVTGTFDWSAKSSTEYVGLMTGKTGAGKPMVMRMDGKFLSKDCGKIKPLK